MLESGRDDPQAQRYNCRQMTRVSKIDVFSQLEPFANPKCYIMIIFRCHSQKCSRNRIS